MKILHVIRDLAIESGGPVTALNGLATTQAKNGHEVTIVTTDDGRPTAAPAGVEVVSLRSWASSWSWTPRMKRTLKTLLPGADIAHLHMVWDHPVLAAAQCAWNQGTPFILRPCGQFDTWSMSQKGRKKRWYLRTVGAPLRRAAAIHFTTARERESARHVIGDRASVIIPNGVQLPEPETLPRRDAFVARYPNLEGRCVILFLGRVHPKKQPDVALRAFAQVAQDDDSVALVLAGPGESSYVESLRKLAHDLGVAQRITITGVLQGAALQEAYACATAFVLPSLQENFGNAIVEAMAAGCPVIVAKNLDLAREIEQAAAGLTCDANVSAFASAIETLLADESRRARLANAGRQFVAQRYAWTPIARATVNAYEAVIRHTHKPQSLSE